MAIVILCALTSCTYIETQESGMTEWDYKMYNEGWQLECLTEGCKGGRFINNISNQLGE